MAVKTDTKPVEAKPVEPAAAPADEAAPARVESNCVVDSDFHVGWAVNGLVCSYHAMHYDAAGKRRK